MKGDAMVKVFCIEIWPYTRHEWVSDYVNPFGWIIIAESEDEALRKAVEDSRNRELRLTVDIRRGVGQRVLKIESARITIREEENIDDFPFHRKIKEDLKKHGLHYEGECHYQ